MPPIRKRRRSFDVPGDAHFLTFSCYKRLPLLSRDRSRRWFLEALNRARSNEQFHLWAYVIMPEHVHLVLAPRDQVTIASLLRTLKQSTSKRAIHWLKENRPDYLDRLSVRRSNGSVGHRFWQRGGGYDRNLRSVADIHEKIAYTHANPVRRGLATRATDWQWSSARAWAGIGAFDMPIDCDSVPPLTVIPIKNHGPVITSED